MIEAASTAAVSLAINLWLVGGIVTATLWVALRVAPDAAPSLRYATSVAAFAAAASLPIAMPWLRSTSVTGLQPDFAPPTWYGIDFSSAPSAMLQMCLIVWIAGSAMLLLRELGGHWALWRLRRGAGTLDPALVPGADYPVVTGPGGNGPTAFGCFAPVIFIPDSLVRALSADTLQFVIEHETAHLRWSDPLVNAVLRVIRAMLWISWPLWKLERIAGVERESRADHAVVVRGAARGVDSAAAYVEALLSVAELSSTDPARGPALAAMTLLERRITRLLRKPRRGRNVRAMIACAGVMAGTLFITEIPLATVTTTLPVGRPAIEVKDRALVAVEFAPAAQSLAPRLADRPLKSPGAQTRQTITVTRMATHTAQSTNTVTARRTVYERR